jgi:hypothetical protein
LYDGEFCQNKECREFGKDCESVRLSNTEAMDRINPPSMPADVRAIARDVVPVTCPQRASLAQELFDNAMNTARRIRYAD